jgi:hypothetical protein
MNDMARELVSSPDAPCVGDRVGARCDVLAEVARGSPRSTCSWQLVPAGSVGKLVGWHDADRAAVSFDGIVFLVRVKSITRL